MILECGCGKKWSLKNELARSGATVLCRACGGMIPIPEDGEGVQALLKIAQGRIRDLQERNEMLEKEAYSRAEHLSRLETEFAHRDTALRKELSRLELPNSWGISLSDLDEDLANCTNSISNLQKQVSHMVQTRQENQAPMELQNIAG